MALAKDYPLLQLRFIPGKTRFQIKRQAHGMVRRVEHHESVFERDPIKMEIGMMFACLRSPKTLHALVQIKRESIIVSDAIFQFMPQLPAVKAVLPNRFAAAGT